VPLRAAYLFERGGVCVSFASTSILKKTGNLFMKNP
jgi:hypothetical protein